MAGDFLKLNRHGTLFYFRRRVPDDLRLVLGRRYVTKALQTGVRALAVQRARILAVRTDNFFSDLRSGMASGNHNDHDNEPITIDFSLSFDFDSLGRKKVKLEDVKPEEWKEAVEAAHALQSRFDQDQLQQAIVVHSAYPEPDKASNRGELDTGKTIMQVFNEFKEYKLAIGAQSDTKGGWSNPGRVDVEQTKHIEAFIDFIGGDRPISEVCTEDVVAFKKYVMTTQEITSAGSRKIRLNRTAAVFKHAKDELHYLKNGFDEEFQYKGKPKKNPYLKFTHSDLKALFESDAYRNHGHQNSSQYWLPLLGLHTGARINELCQLLRSDITEKDGIPIISILDKEENKRLKTDAARRHVPIHSTLIELGFLDFVKTISSGRIFPHLREAPDKPGDFGQKASDDFTEYRRSVGVGNQAGQGKSNKAFHSFRTTFIAALRDAGVDQERRMRLVGHEYDDTHNGTYNGGDILDMFPIATLKRDVESVRYPIDFTPYRLK